MYESCRRAAQETFPSRQLAEAGSASQDAPADDGGGAAAEPAVDEPLTDDEVYDFIYAAYQQVVSYDSEEAIGQVIDAFNSYYLEPDLSVRRSESQTAYQLRDAIQQTIDDIDALEAPEDTVYVEDIQHVRQLAEWMYGRVDQICQSWDVSLAIPEGESTLAQQDEILAPMRRAGTSDLENYDANVDAWEPQRK